MKQSFCFFKILITAILLKNDVFARLNSSCTFVWNASDSRKVFNIPLVSTFHGFQSYGTVLAGEGYSSTQDEAVFQGYFPFNPSYGEIVPEVRLGKYNNQGWSKWSTFFTSANAYLSSIDWSAKNVIAYGNILISKAFQTSNYYRLDVYGIISSPKVIVNPIAADLFLIQVHKGIENLKQSITKVWKYATD